MAAGVAAWMDVITGAALCALFAIGYALAVLRQRFRRARFLQRQPMDLLTMYQGLASDAVSFEQFSTIWSDIAVRLGIPPTQLHLDDRITELPGSRFSPIAGGFDIDQYVVGLDGTYSDSAKMEVLRDVVLFAVAKRARTG